MSNRIYLFKGFERFWHWSQAGLIITLLLSGFEVHGSYRLFGFESAVNAHTTAAWLLIGLWLFAIFWHFTTGEWKQYLPTLEKITAVIHYYAVGIFKGESHPYKVTPVRKHNPLQRLAYLWIMLMVGPLLWVTGGAYLFYDQWPAWGWDAFLNLEWVAFLHAAGAFMMLLFLIAHVYLITTGHTVGAHLKAMITGWEDEH